MHQPSNPVAQSISHLLMLCGMTARMLLRVDWICERSLCIVVAREVIGMFLVMLAEEASCC